jgi:hypothetical protein
LVLGTVFVFVVVCVSFPLQIMTKIVVQPGADIVSRPTIFDCAASSRVLAPCNFDNEKLLLLLQGVSNPTVVSNAKDLLAALAISKNDVDIFSGTPLAAIQLDKYTQITDPELDIEGIFPPFQS